MVCHFQLIRRENLKYGMTLVVPFALALQACWLLVAYFTSVANECWSKMVKERSYSTYKTFQCGKCTHQTFDKSKLERHMKSVHNDVIINLHACHKCEAAFSHKVHLKKHLRAVHLKTYPA